VEGIIASGNKNLYKSISFLNDLRVIVVKLTRQGRERFYSSPFFPSHFSSRFVGLDAMMVGSVAAVSARRIPGYSLLRLIVLFCCLVRLLAPLGASAALDPGLDAAIRDALAKPSGTITTTDLLELVTLNAGSRSIANLSGIQPATNITSLDLRYNLISDPTPLQTLTQISVLSVRANPLTNLQAVAALTNLTWLDLSRDFGTDFVSDVSSLASLPRLSTLMLAGCGYTNATLFKLLGPVRQLFLQNNSIASLVDLAGLTNIDALYLSGNQVVDAGPLTNLPRLASLHLDRNLCTNAAFVASLSNLTNVSLANNSLASFSAPARLTNAAYVNLSHNSLTNVSALSQSTVLKQLNVSFNGLSDISPLQNLTTLSSLNISSNNVSSISSLSGMTNLVGLRFSGDHVTNGSPLYGLKSIQTFDGSQNALTNLDFLSAMTDLRRVCCSGNVITNASSLQGLSSLTTLDLHGNPVTNASPLEGLTNLTYLDLSGTAIGDGSFLANLSQLRTLRVDGTAISNLGAVAACAQLSVLGCERTPVSSIAVVTNCPALTELDVSGSGVTDLSPLIVLTNLALLRIDALPGLTSPILNQSNSLVFLSAQRSVITDATFAVSCRSLKSLYLADNALGDVSVLTNLQQLSHLSLSHNIVTSISPLLALSNLVQLDVDNNYLDLSATSAATATIDALTQRGVIVNYTPQHTLPSISPIPDQTIGMNGASRSLGFSYSPSTATVSASSSNTNLVPDSPFGLQIGIRPGNLVVYPTPETTGTTVITLTISTPKGMSASTSFNVTVIPSTTVTVSDPTLELALRTRLGRPEGAITTFDLAGLTTLSLSGTGVQGLAGLESAQNLVSLDISFNPITNYSGLGLLTNLESLVAEDIGLTNLQAVAALTLLTNLDVSENDVTECSGLANLTLLSTLQLDDNPLGSLGCLATLTNLVQLYAEDCALTNCQAVTNLPQLALLDIDRNLIQDISPLASLTNLTELDLTLNRILDLSPLAGLWRLSSLQVAFNPPPVGHVEVISGLTNLTVLDMESDGITNLTFLLALQKLSHLNLAYNGLSNILPIADLPSLADLSLRGNQITDFSPISGSASLVTLDLGQNFLQSLIPLLAMTNLQTVDVSLNSLDLTTGSPVQQVLAALTSRGTTVIAYQDPSYPMISPIIFQLIEPNATSAPLAFSINDPGEDPCTLTVSATSSNPTVVSNSGLALTGFCGDLALVITPNPGQTGITFVTISAKDLLGATNGVTFSVEVIADHPVVLPDPALYAFVWGILGDPPGPITLYDIRNLQYLYSGGLGITNLDGLQAAINVGYADLSNNRIRDGSIVSNWIGLQTLILDNNPLTNINFISSLPQLGILSLRNTGIKNAAPLAGETNLTFLDLSYDPITNANFLANDTNLEVLDLDGTGIKDLSFVTSLPRLESISFAHDEVIDLSPLLALPDLISINLEDNGLYFFPGTPNASVLAALQAAGVYIAPSSQPEQPVILPGSPYLFGSNLLSILFTGYAGRSYTLQDSTNMLQWGNVTITTGTGLTNCFTNVPQGPLSFRFFRIAVIAPPPPLSLGIPVLNPDGSYKIPAFGVTRTSVLQVSSNLLHWSSIATNSSTSNVFFIDLGATNVSRRFYRLWLP
jgi:Leucine-rich repeat (LRR) protein